MTSEQILVGASRPTSPPRSDVVVIGAGFAGLEVAKALGHAGIATTVIDRHNHHLFQPLLYQVATAALSATDVAEPIRKVLRRQKSVQVLFGDVSEIDTKAGVAGDLRAPALLPLSRPRQRRRPRVLPRRVGAGSPGSPGR